MELAPREIEISRIELVDVGVHTDRRDYVFAGSPEVWSAYNLEQAQLVLPDLEGDLARERCGLWTRVSLARDLSEGLIY